MTFNIKLFSVRFGNWKFVPISICRINGIHINILFLGEYEDYYGNDFIKRSFNVFYLWIAPKGGFYYAQIELFGKSWDIKKKTEGLPF